MLIVVEGCVGAGKSTVASGLAAYRKSEALFEDFGSNPFLPAFYDDPVANATETEFTFLLLHFHQLKKHADSILNSELITDFHIGKDLLYADLNLSDSRSLRIFKELFDLVSEQIPKATLMICLSASTELVVERIRSRKREFELKINPGYYASINAAYEEFFGRYRGRKLKISMDEWDFLKSPDLFGKLSLLVDEKLKTE
jgi:deoxyadenosine/deoxycytidine kinase